eukprot:1851658-Amphidinium_carterae.1
MSLLLMMMRMRKMMMMRRRRSMMMMMRMRMRMRSMMMMMMMISWRGCFWGLPYRNVLIGSLMFPKYEKACHHMLPRLLPLNPFPAQFRD